MSSGNASIINGRPSADIVRFYYVYILICSDKKPYTGCTDNLKDRINKHSKGYVTSTKSRLPVKLISYFAFNNKYAAFKFEKYLKSGSGRAFLKRHLFEVPNEKSQGL